MKNIALLLFAISAIQYCTSATVDDAETQLKALREKTSAKLEAAYLNQTRMSNDVDATSLAAKEYGKFEIQKKHDKYQAKLQADRALVYRCRGSRKHIYEHTKKSNTDDLIRCVDEKGSESVNVLADQRKKLQQYVWDAIYEEEKHIIACDQNKKCLDSAVADIKDKIDEVIKVIDAELDISEHNKEVQLQLIKACASSSISNAEHEYSKIPTCRY